MQRRAIPIAVAALALALFWWTRPGDDRRGPYSEMDSDVQECTDNLLAIHDGLKAYHERFGHLPEPSGVAFLAELVRSGVWENTPASVARLTCPGAHAQPVPAGTRYDRPETLTAASSAYAGPDVEHHPLPRFPAGGPELQALVACDNAHGSNHDGVSNVLYSDRSVRSFTLAQLRERGDVPETAVYLVIGPDSPLEDVRTLVGD